MRQTLEYTEHSFALGVWNTDAVVPKFEFNAVGILLGLDSDSRRPGVLAVFDCVTYDVVDNALQ